MTTSSIAEQATKRGDPLDSETSRLLTVARQCFAERGFRGTSADDIARAAGVTRVTLYRRLGTREHLVGLVYTTEAQRLMLAINKRFRPYEALDWDPAVHIEDLLLGTIYDVRDSSLLQSLLVNEREETIALLASGSAIIVSNATVLVAEFIRKTWRSDIHTRSMSNEECDELSMKVASVVARFLFTLVIVSDGPPDLSSEEEIRELARGTLVSMILQH